MSYKNIVLFHLESINTLTYQMQPWLFPNLHGMDNSSVYFNNFYSTATSTLMVITDLFYGSMYRAEESSNLKEGYKKKKEYVSLFDELKQNNYETQAILWPKILEKDKIVKEEMLGIDIPVYSASSHSDFVKKIETILEHEGPFALFTGDFVPHTSYLKYGRMINKDTYHQWLDSRRFLDECCGEIIRILNEKNKLQDTLVIFYGDHGDDFWGHRMHNGYTHAIEPYTNIIHTPLIMWIPEYKGGKVNDRLFSTMDLKGLILSIVKNSKTDFNNLMNRQYVFSRNLFANQKSNYMSLSKGYSVTDGDYLLLVTARGLELYNNKMDPCNTCNLLEFFSITRSGDIKFHKRLLKVKSGHFFHFFKPLEIEHLIETYTKLKKILSKEVNQIYERGNVPKEYLKKELSFYKINYTHGYQFYFRSLADLIDNIRK